MVKWLVIGTAVSMGWATAASAQLKGLSSAEIAGVARTRALDLRISQPELPLQRQPLVGGMLVSQEVAPNAVIGLGLAGLYGKKKSGTDVRINGGPSRPRKPAVTFVLRF
jgi:hypothetical protein